DGRAWLQTATRLRPVPGRAIFHSRVRSAETVERVMWGYPPGQLTPGNTTEALAAFAYAGSVAEVHSSDHVEWVDIDAYCRSAIVWPAAEAKRRHADMAGQTGVSWGGNR
ncbi:unnamed protein product, partial [Phaeothamnion confervicola]